VATSSVTQYDLTAGIGFEFSPPLVPAEVHTGVSDTTLAFDMFNVYDATDSTPSLDTSSTVNTSTTVDTSTAPSDIDMTVPDSSYPDMSDPGIDTSVPDSGTSVDPAVTGGVY
jgi:hypothetical protein